MKSFSEESHKFIRFRTSRMDAFGKFGMTNYKKIKNFILKDL